MCILYKKSFVKKFQLGDNKPKKNSKARVFQWFIELNPKRNQRHALGNSCTPAYLSAKKGGGIRVARTSEARF